MRSGRVYILSKNWLAGLFLWLGFTNLLCASLVAQQSPAATEPASLPAQAQPADPSGPKPDPPSAATRDDGSESDATKGISNDRLFFALPNFLTLENSAHVPPLTAGQKFKVVARGSFDPIQFVWYGFLSGISRRKTANPVLARVRRAMASATERPSPMARSKTS